MGIIQIIFADLEEANFQHAQISEYSLLLFFVFACKKNVSFRFKILDMKPMTSYINVKLSLNIRSFRVWTKKRPSCEPFRCFSIGSALKNR